VWYGSRLYLSALDTILKYAFEILQGAHDNREKVAALELFKDTHLVKLELLSNATTIDSALNYIRNKQRQKELALHSTTVTNNDDQPSHKHTVF
jgi:hypothetical protein